METTAVIHPAYQYDFDVLVNGLMEEVSKGYVYKRDNGNLSLFVYSQECVYEDAWNEFSMLARGLILDIPNRKIVAASFEKFFNLSQGKDAIPNLPFEVFEKIDGSLIIIYHYNGKWNCATKGSFDSDQAKWAQNLLDKNINLNVLLKGETYLCEAIYPENKIVIQYADSGLVLLGAYDKDGKEYNFDDLCDLAPFMDWTVAPRHSYNSIAELISVAKTLPGDREGFVLRFSNGLRLKIKGDEYCRIHSLVSRLTPLAVWEIFTHGPFDDLENMRKDLPEEFWADFDAILNIFQDQYQKAVDKYDEQSVQCANWSPKEIGLSNIDQDVKSYVFSTRRDPNFRNTQKCREWIMKRFRPTANVLPGYVPSYGVKMVQTEE